MDSSHLFVDAQVDMAQSQGAKRDPQQSAIFGIGTSIWELQ